MSTRQILRFLLHWAGLGPDLAFGLARHYVVELRVHMFDVWWCHHVLLTMGNGDEI